MKLGKKMSEMYDNPTSSKDQMIHPEAHLPAELFGKAYKIGDTCELTMKGTIESMHKDGYRVKFTHGEEIGAISKAKQKSLLASAKVNT